ncbi:hypothetical protein M0R01_01375 [bacterium]|nr:hypothetical protein [bacterium]
MKNKTDKKGGFLVIEAILAVSVLVLFFVAFVGVIVFNRQNQDSLSNRGVAILLSEEGLEAVRSIRDIDFERITDGQYGLTKQNGKWEIVSGVEKIDRFKRYISISSINAEKKLVTSKVSWEENGNIKDFYLDTYLTKWK